MENPYVNIIQKHCCQSSFRQSGNLSGNNLRFSFGKHGNYILWTKEEWNHLACYQHSFISVDLAACTSGRAPLVLKGICRFLWKYTFPCRWCCFPAEALLILAREFKCNYCNSLALYWKNPKLNCSPDLSLNENRPLLKNKGILHSSKNRFFSCIARIKFKMNS